MIYKSKIIDGGEDSLLKNLRSKAEEIKKELNKIPNPNKEIKSLESKMNEFYRKLGATAGYHLPGRSAKDNAKGDKLFDQFSTQIEIIGSEVKRLKDTQDLPRQILLDKIDQIKRIINKIIIKNAKRKGVEPLSEFTSNIGKYSV